MDREGTPAGPVRRPSEELDAPEFRARGFLQALPTAQAPAAPAQAAAKPAAADNDVTQQDRVIPAAR